MKQTKTIISILLFSFFLIALGGYYLAHYFARAYTPPDLTITKNEISSSGGFMDPVTIEKLKVDSLGKEQRPVRYVIESVTTCFIKQKDSEPPVALKQIKLNVPGRYSWSDENVKISVTHSDGFSKRSDPAQKLISNIANQKSNICPLKFENGNWYFINFQDPLITGVYVYIDKSGILEQHIAYSGVSPIK